MDGNEQKLRLGSERRKRKYSSSLTLTSKEISANRHRYGETILVCTVYINKGIRDLGNETVLKYTCALFNSGGGILHMRNILYTHGVAPKDLDTWWSAMENKMADIISSDDLCNYIDLVGNYDDEDLYLFVKSSEHLCTIDYHSRLPTDTATHEVSYRSAMKIIQQTGEPSDLKSLPDIPTEYYYRKTNDMLKQETKQIQFKQLSAPKTKEGKSLPSKFKYMVTKYLSAFANHEGGHIFFGIEDVRAAVVGEELSEGDEEKTVHMMTERMEPVIWGNTEFKPLKGVHWDINFYPVNNVPSRLGRRVVVVVSVCKFPGGVFTSTPESYFVNDKGEVESWPFNQWKEALLSRHRDKPELHSRFVKLDLNVPQAPLVFTLQHTIQAIKDKLLHSKTDWLQPRHALDNILKAEDKSFILNLLNLFKQTGDLCLCVNCWGLQVSHSPPKNVLCDVFLLSKTRGCHLFTFTNSDNPGFPKHTYEVATFLKKRLVLRGGCIEKFGIVCHVINIYKAPLDRQKMETSDNTETTPDLDDLCSSDGFAVYDDATVFSDVFYPSHYNINDHKFESLLKSLIIYMAAYKPVDFTMLSDVKREDVLSLETYFFLLTCDQFELLWTQQFTKELWIHGPPGAGKTVAAVQFIQELRRSGCQKEEVLYLAENEMLCSYVRSFGICVVFSRREFLKKNNGDSTENPFNNVKNVVVDEAQNFKARDGDWYAKIGTILEKHSKSKKTCAQKAGFFWVFMDYAQKVHKFEAGLPSIVGKNNFMLSEVSRNSKEIFDYAMRFMNPEDQSQAENQVSGIKRVESLPTLGHEYKTGENVDVVSCKSDDLKDAISKVLAGIVESGVDIKDIAILVGKRKDKENMTQTMGEIKQEIGFSENITMDTVKRFSGLDKSAVIGVNPHCNEEHADFNKFVLNLATRAKEKLVIISSSEDIQQKLKAL